MNKKEIEQELFRLIALGKGKRFAKALTKKTTVEIGELAAAAAQLAGKKAMKKINKALKGAK